MELLQYLLWKGIQTQLVFPLHQYFLARFTVLAIRKQFENFFFGLEILCPLL